MSKSASVGPVRFDPESAIHFKSRGVRGAVGLASSEHRSIRHQTRGEWTVTASAPKRPMKGWTQAMTCGAQPNESRLSCGAELKHSQMEFYHTARRTFAGLIAEGRRQLQAHVRLRTTSHSLGPSLHREPRSTRRNRPLTAIVMPNGPMLGTCQAHRPPHTTGLSVDSAFRIEPNRPDGWWLRLGAVLRGCSQNDLVLGELRSLTDRA